MSGYALHPEAFLDIDEIAAYIGEDSFEAAHRVVDEIYRAIQSAVPFPHSGHPAQTSPVAPYALSAYGIT
jgi:plasmid stabilization system protein ParE